MVENEDSVYSQLRKEIDERMPVNFPSTESGIEINILKHLFTPDEAKIALHLSALGEPVEKIHKRVAKAGITISVEELGKTLEVMHQKGAIMGGKVFPKPKLYSLALYALGMYEFQAGFQTKEFAEAAVKYSTTTYYKEFNRKDHLGQMRTIPVEKSLVPENYVNTYDNVRAIINNVKGPISVHKCVCKESKDLVGDPCKLGDLRRCCIMLNRGAEYYLEKHNTSAVQVSKEEILNLLDKYQKAGYVLQPENDQDPNFICVCCGCCCDVLRGLKQFPRPSEYFMSNYYAQVSPEKCDGCGVCVKRCQMDAIKMINDKSTVDLDRCIGCGNCITICKTGARKLITKETNRHIPPKDRDALYQKLMMKKRGFVGTIKMLGNMLLGRKI